MPPPPKPHPIISDFPVTLQSAPILHLPPHFCLYEGAPQIPTLSHPKLQNPLTLRPQTSQGPRPSPPIAVKQGHSLLHMYMEPTIPLGALLSWWSSLWKNWVVRRTYVLLTMGLQSPSLSSSHFASSPARFSEFCRMVGTKHPPWIGESLVQPPQEQPHLGSLHMSFLTTAKGIDLLSADMIYL